MEERMTGGKEKKYVLYTVVGEEKARTGCGIWTVRILLGSLLLAALAVVPYVSLRLAQIHDRTLVVFQQVPHHNRNGAQHHSTGTKITARPLEAASLLKITNTTLKTSANRTQNNNFTLITFHESAVTLSLLEDTTNLSSNSHNITTSSSETRNTTINFDDITSPNITLAPTTSLSSNSSPKEFESTPKPTESYENQTNTFINGTKDNSVINISTTSLKTETTSSLSLPITPETVSNITTTSKILRVLKESTSTSTTTIPPVKTHTTLKPMRHKLAYVASAVSGNHVGGFGVWKTNKNVTNWLFFFENIPIEYQSHQDNVDHEMRSMLAAVRLWHDQWHDYHVVLRSQNQAISKSKHPTRAALIKELEKFSEGHFTYELEWRLRKDDAHISIAYSLARLYREYDYWFNEFEERVDELLGKQDWSIAKESRRVPITQNLFHTDTQETSTPLGDLTALGLY